MVKPRYEIVRGTQKLTVSEQDGELRLSVCRADLNPEYLKDSVHSIRLDREAVTVLEAIFDGFMPKEFDLNEASYGNIW